MNDMTQASKAQPREVAELDFWVPAIAGTTNQRLLDVTHAWFGSIGFGRALALAFESFNRLFRRLFYAPPELTAEDRAETVRLLGRQAYSRHCAGIVSQGRHVQTTTRASSPTASL